MARIRTQTIKLSAIKFENDKIFQLKSLSLFRVNIKMSNHFFFFTVEGILQSAHLRMRPCIIYLNTISFRANN